MTDKLGDLFESEATRQRAQADAQDANPAYVAAVEAKRRAEIDTQIRQGLRDGNGDWIETDDALGDEEE